MAAGPPVRRRPRSSRPSVRLSTPPDQQDRRDVAQGRRSRNPALDMPARERQKWLRAQGYNIVVDGDWGPMSRSAFAAQQRGVKSRYWNERNAPVEEPERSASHVTPNNQRDVVTRKPKPAPRPQQPHRSAAPPRVKSGKRPGRTVMPKRSAGSPIRRGAIMPGIDDDQYANALIEAEFGPIAAELSRAEEKARAVGDNRVAEIQDMYSRYYGDVTASNAAAAAERTKMFERTQGLPAAIAAGVPISSDVAAELAKRGDIEADYTAAISASAAGNEARMASSASEGKLFAAEQARREQMSTLGEIAGQRRDLAGQRGAKLSATKEELRRFSLEQKLKERELNASIRGEQTRNMLALAELQAAQSALPMENAKQQAEVAYILSQIRANNASMGDAALDRELRRAQIAQTRKETKLLGRPKPGKKGSKVPRNFVELNPAERLELQNQILSGVEGMGNNTKAIEAINSRLRALGYKPRANRRVGQFAYDTAKAAGLHADPKWWGL